MSVSGSASSTTVGISPRWTSEHPLSVTQRRIWDGQRIDRDAPVANMGKLHRIVGPLDPERLVDAVDAVVARSDALRSVVVERPGDPPVMRVLAHPPASTEIIDLPAAALDEWVADRVSRPIDAQTCAYDSALLRHGEADWTWWMDIHHVVTDAWASALVYRSVGEEYVSRGDESGTSPSTGGVPDFYRFVSDQEAARRSDDPDRVPWATASVDPTPIAPYGPPGPKTSAVVRRPVDIDFSQLADLVTAEGPYRTMSTELGLLGFLAVGAAALLHRLDGRSVLTFGIPIHHRRGREARDVVGPLMELYPLTVVVDPDRTFAESFRRVQRDLFALLRHARPGNSPDLGYDAVLNVLTVSFDDFAGMPTATSWIRSGHVDRAHPIRIHTYDYGDGGSLEVDLNDGLSIDGAHRAFPEHLAAVLRAAVERPEATVADVDILTDDDRLRLAELDPGAPSAALGGLVHEVVSSRLGADPGSVTAEHGGRSLTAGQLDRAAEALAGWLAAEGVGSGSRVGVRMPRSLDVLAAVHGILRSGAAFVFLDPADPPARHDFVIADADLALVLDELPFDLEDPPPGVGDGLRSGPADVAPDDLAYILYTSGSTGEPKGVPIPHRGLSDYLAFAIDAYVDPARPPVMPLHSSLVFDLTITSLFLPQLTGGRTIVVDGDAVSALSSIAADRRIDTLKATPGQLEVLTRLVDAPLPLRVVIVGGEAFRRPVAEAFSRRCADGVRIFNEYGPTEAVVGCMIHEWHPDRDRGPDVPIGRACPGAEVHVLDATGRPAPPGSWGELYVGRPGMADGYLGLPDLSAERFVRIDAVSSHPLYRTGDRVRLQDGAYVYGGRMDDQLSLRGVRLEPGEIEAALVRHPRITSAVVRTWTPEGRAVGRRLCRRCGLGTDVPGVEVGSDGVCGVCTDYDRVAAQADDWFRAPADLDERRRAARARRRGDFDCIHLLSGGKDSTYALYRLVEQGWDVHALTLDNGFISDGAKENVRRSVADLGISHEFVTTDAMNEIFRDSLDRYSNVCNGCYKTIYTLAVARAHELGVPVIVTGLSRGQFFETRLVPHQFEEGRFDPDAIDRTVLQARRTYHHTRDAVTELLPEQSVFERTDLDVLEEIEFVDFYRYVDVELAEVYDFLDRRAPWVRPRDTGRSTNCLVNAAGIFVHNLERGYHNYAEPYSWDVRLGHKTRLEALEELDDDLDVDEVREMLATIGYEPSRPEVLTAWYVTDDGREVELALLRAHLSELLPERAVPSAFVHLDEMPLAAGAKVDVAALPTPGRTGSAAGEFVAPTTETEALAASVWADVLGVARVGLDDDFFALGGASLAALEVVAAMEAHLDVDLPDAFVFEHRTLVEFAAAVDDRSGSGIAREPIPELPPDEQFALSDGEQAMLFEQWSNPDDVRYNVTRWYSVPGAIDIDRLREALGTVVRRHAPLHVAFDADRTPLPVDAALSVRPIPGPSRREDHEELALAERRVPFDLEHGPLVRAHVGPVDDGTTSVLLALHHASIDAGTFDLLWDEIDAAYHGRPLPELPVTVAAHARWQRDRVGASGEWWREFRTQLDSTAPPPTFPRLQVAEADGYLTMPAAVGTAEVAATGTTPFAVALAASAIVTSSFTSSLDVEIGVTASRKDHRDSAPLIGYFLNTLPLHLRVASEDTVHDVLMRSGRTVTDALPHRAYPFARMVSDARLAGERVPDVSVMLAYEQLAPARFGEQSAQHRILASGTSVADATFFVQERGDALQLSIEYRGTVIGEELAGRLLTAFAEVLTACCRQPHHGVDEWRGMLAAPDRDGPELPAHRLVIDRFVDIAKRDPDRLALRVGDGSQRTYAELLSGARAVAAAVAGRPPTNGRVGVAVSRGTSLIEALLGVHLAGHAYVPLDPTAPRSRLRSIVDHARLESILVDTVSAGIFDPALELHLGDPARPDDVDDGDGAGVAAPEAAIAPDAPAYVMFTSGSTGVPAGVEVTHASLAASTAARDVFYGPDGPPRFLLTSSIGFDSSIVGLFWPLASGGAIVLPTEDQVHDVDRLAELVDVERATHLLMVPTLYTALLRRHPRSLEPLEVAIVAGEACPPSLPGAHHESLPGTTLVNEYGPTECTVWASATRLDPDRDEVPIGSPIAGARLRVAGHDGHPLAPGVPGELWIAGPGVARGYVSGRTDEAFVERDGHRWYRSGDVVRDDGAGQLLFAGRLDDQLNVGGVRVEPAEMEEVLIGAGVLEAVVVASVVNGRPTVVAHVVDPSGTCDPTELRELVVERFGAAAPRVVQPVERLPRNIHGKVDRRAAAELPVAPAGDAAPVESFTDPSGGSLHRVVGVWRRALARPDLRADDDFFLNGGDSLAAVEIVTALGEDAGRSLPIALLLAHPTPRSMSAALDVEVSESTGDDAEVRWAVLRPGEPGGPVLVMTVGWDEVLAYRDLADALPAEVEVRAVAVIGGEDDDASPLMRVGPVAEIVASELLAGSAERPLALFGWSVGGVLAQEVGRLLEDAGRTPITVALVDTLYPGEHRHVWANRWSKYRSLVARGAFSEIAAEIMPAIGRRVERLPGGARLRSWIPEPDPSERPPSRPIPVTALDHDPHQSRGPAVLYAASTTSRRRTEIPWRGVLPDLEVVEVEGRHRGYDSVMGPDRVRAIATDLGNRLARR